MIDDQIRQLARPAFLPQTQHFDVSSWIACDADGDGTVDRVRLNLEVSPPHLVFENSSQAMLDGTGVTVRDATPEELATILAGLQASPPHPAFLTASEALERLTGTEEQAVFAAAPALAYRLFVAQEPFAWETFATSIQQLATAGVPIDAVRILTP